MRSAIALAAAPLAPFSIRSESHFSLQDVIARHTRARGGAAALDRIHSQAVELWITEKASTIVGKYKCTDAPSFRIDIYDAGKHVFCEGLDSEGPWIWPGGQAAPKQGVPDAKRTGLEGIEFNLYGLHAFQRRGHKLELIGRSVIERTNYYEIEVELKDSYTTYLFINPDSWMIERRRDFRALHPDINLEKKYVEKQYSDFRMVDGVVTPFIEHQIDLATGQIVQVSAVQSMQFNPSLDPSVMKRTYATF